MLPIPWAASHLLAEATRNFRAELVAGPLASKHLHLSNGCAFDEMIYLACLRIGDVVVESAGAQTSANCEIAFATEGGSTAFERALRLRRRRPRSLGDQASPPLHFLHAGYDSSKNLHHCVNFRDIIGNLSQLIALIFEVVASDCMFFREMHFRRAEIGPESGPRTAIRARKPRRQRQKPRSRFEPRSAGAFPKVHFSKFHAVTPEDLDFEGPRGGSPPESQEP